MRSYRYLPPKAPALRPILPAARPGQQCQHDRVAGSALWVFGHSTDQFFDLDIRQHSLALALDIACNSLAGVAAAVAQSLTLGPR
jgi:hypothetical protein